MPFLLQVIYDKYINETVSAISTPTPTAHPSNSHSSGQIASADIECLRWLSRRIHFGKFIAESKYREDPVGYNALIAINDRQALMDRLTNVEVEMQVLERVYQKALRYSSDTDGRLAEMARQMYRDFIIPLTKKVEIEYLFDYTCKSGREV
jgi:chorismate mutase